MAIFPLRYHSSLPKAEDQNSMFISHPLSANLLSFLHFSFMNMFIPMTMLIANFSLLLSRLLSLTCEQFSVRRGEHLNSAITKLHASVPPRARWVSPKSTRADRPSTNHIG